MPRLFLAAALFLAFVPRAGAYTYMETAYGTPMVGLSTKGIAMAGALTAVPDGSFSLVQNPAMMSEEVDGLADLTLRAVRYDETRFVPLWDSFDAYDKDTAVEENPSTYTGLNGGFVFRPRGVDKLMMGAGFFERYNMQFDFANEQRSPIPDESDRLVSRQTISSRRAIYSATAGVSYREKVLSVGAALHYYFGDIEFNNATVYTSPSTAPRDTLLSRDMTGIGGTFGVAATVSERVTIAASYNLPVTFDVDWHRETLTSTGRVVTEGTDNTKYPGRLALGLAYRPRNVLRTTFALDVSRTYWEDLEDPVLAANPLIHIGSLRNNYEYRFGLEHIFYNDLPARLGFYYREAYAADNVDDAGITFGTAYRFQNFDVGIAGDVSKRTSRQGALVVRSSPLDSRVDKVQDSILRGAIDVRYRF